jgi:autotransporter-associated beta strand protein
MRFSTHLQRHVCICAAFVAAFLLLSGAHALAQQRVYGLDVSAWQGSLSQTSWNSIHGDGKSFAFIRSDRGGTTGFYNQSDASNANRLNTFSQRYDDTYFANNITRATAAGMLAGQYHFARMDISSYELDGQVIIQTGTDEANHMLQEAGPYMRPGYLLPIFDFESGSGVRSAEQQAQFAIAFSDRIYAVAGIRPGVYIGGNYASPMESVASAATLVSDYPVQWTARWPTNPNTATANPSDYTSTVYGPWDNFGNSQPWHFWQYTSSGTVAGYSGNVDLDVSHGTIEYLKDHLVPAAWTNDISGDWSKISNWNSDNRDYNAADNTKGPAPRLPGVGTSGANDTVILDRPSAAITVAHGSGTTSNIRKLYVAETLNITGGSLTVNYDPTTTDAMGNGTTILGSWAPGSWNSQVSAEFNGTVTLSGSASLSAQKLQVDASRTFTLAGGTLSFNTINLMPSSGTPGKLAITGNVTINALNNFQNNATATIANGSGSGTSGSIDLGAAVRAITVNDGTAATDLLVSVPMTGTGGGLTKLGAGAMALTASNTFTGVVAINQGSLAFSGTGTATSASGFTVQGGATLQLDNSGTNNNNRIGTVPVTLLDGTLNFVGNATTEATGTFSALAGASAVALSGTGTSTLAFGSYMRTTGATVNFTGTDSTHRATFTGGVIADNFIDQGTFVGGVDYAVYNNGTNYVRAMIAGGGASDYSTTFLTGRHVKLSASATGVTGTNIKTLNLAGAAVGLDLAASNILSLTNGGIIKSGGGLGSITGTGASLNSTSEYVINSATAGDELAVAVSITGSAPLTKTGPGVLTLSNTSNSYSGTTTIAQGALKLGASNVVPDGSNIVVGSGATFNMNSFSDTVGNVTMRDGTIGSAGTLTLAGPSPTITYNGVATGATISTTNLGLSGAGGLKVDIADGAAANDLTISSVLQNGSGMGLIKVGAGTLHLTGNNSFTGGLSIDSGTLSVSSINSNALLNQPLGASSSPISLGIVADATLQYTGAASATLNRQISQGFSGSTTFRTTAGALTIGTGGILGSGQPLIFDAAGGNITVTSVISSNGTLTKIGPNTLMLSAGNSYSSTIINEGTVAYSSNNNLGQNSTIVFNGGVLRTLASVSDNHSVTLNSAGGTIDTNGFGSTFLGVFSGAGGLTKVGTGTLTMSAINTYTGTTTINAGTLSLSGETNAASKVEINSGGTLAGTGTVQGDAQVIGTGIINFSSSGKIHGALTAFGGNWNGAGQVENGVTVSGGTFTLGSGASLTITTGAAVNIDGGTLAGTGSITNNVWLVANPINYSTINFGNGGSIGGNLTVNSAGGPTSTSIWAGSGTVTGTTAVIFGSLYVNGTMGGAGGLTLGSGANLHGVGTVNKTLTLTGNNRVGGMIEQHTTGASSPTLGTLTIGAPVVWGASNLFIADGPVSTTGDTISGTLTIESPSDLQQGYDLNYVVSLGGTGTAAITGTGSLLGNGVVTKPVTITGNGIINLSSPPTLPSGGSTLTSTLTATGGFWNGAGSVTGLTSVTSGTFTIGSGANLTANGNVMVSGSGAIAGPGTITGSVTYTSSAADTFTGVLAGSGKTLTVNSTTGGILTLGGNNSFTGALTIPAGTLNVTSINATAAANQPLGNSAAAISLGSASANGALQYSGASGATLNRGLSLGGAGGGTVRATNGALTLGSTIAGNGHPLTFDAAGANIQANGTISGTGTSLTKIGNNTLTLAAGSNTYTGATNINAGTLMLNGSQTGTGLTTVATGAALGGNGTIGGALTNNGTVSPGASFGTLNVNGNTTFGANSHYAVELSGTSADKLAITGNLDLTALGNFLDVIGTGTGSSWIIATYTGALTGIFETIPSGYWVNYGTGSNSQVTLVHGLLGDFNSDGIVDAGDYVTWRKNEGTNNALANDNGLGAPVGSGHYDLWRANFGNGSGSGSGGGSAQSGAFVPETTAIVLLISGLIPLVGYRGRRRFKRGNV